MNAMKMSIRRVFKKRQCEANSHAGGSRVARFLKHTLYSIMTCAVAAVMGGCVHEFPELGDAREVVLHVSHNVGWTYHEMTITRADRPAYAPVAKDACARYHIKIYPRDNQSVVLYEHIFFVNDLTRSDFIRSISVPPGDYDLWVWSDYADIAGQNSYFFKSDDFSQIVYSEPYNGNNELRDAFRGMVQFSVRESMEESYREDVYVELERPLARYEFISTDLQEFITAEITRNEALGRDAFGNPIDKSAAGSEESTKADLAESPATRFPIEQYHVKMVYSGYMPSVFNNFINKPVNSATGMSYDADIVKLNDKEARLGFDYVMVNGHESSVKVTLEVYDPKGQLVGRTNPIDVVTKRSMNTTVRGKFLTSQVSGGVGIDPDFTGSFNVPI